MEYLIVFDIVGNVIEILSATPNSIENFKKLNHILTDAKNKNYSHGEINSKIKKELPELSSISDILPKTRNELYAFIALILTAIGLTMNINSSNNEISKLQIKEITENAIEKSLLKYNIPKKQNNILPTKKKTGRNQPCPCGSGKKFKKCCIKIYA